MMRTISHQIGGWQVHIDCSFTFLWQSKICSFVRSMAQTRTCRRSRLISSLFCVGSRCCVGAIIIECFTSSSVWWHLLNFNTRRFSFSLDSSCNIHFHVWVAGLSMRTRRVYALARAGLEQRLCNAITIASAIVRIRSCWHQLFILCSMLSTTFRCMMNDEF